MITPEPVFLNAVPAAVYVYEPLIAYKAVELRGGSATFPGVGVPPVLADTCPIGAMRSSRIAAIEVRI